MRRLVYSPKVWVYIKGRTDPNTGQAALYDVSDYVVSGGVTRRVNEVSSAEVILRNPNRMFTQLGNPAFLPMDPITIFLQRHATNPVRVFTGWLDESPYYQMRPGTCTLAASCTLKKLQLTYWDPALPFVMSLLKDIGWAVDTSNGLLVHPSTLGGGPVVKGNISNTNLTDGGFGQLLYAIMKLVGGWDDASIHIENLPPTIVPWITSLFKKFETQDAAIKSQFEQFFTQMIGTTAFGSGGGSVTGSGGPTPAGATQTNVQTVYCIAQKYNVPPEFVMATIDQECSWNPKSSSGCCIGWFQINCCGFKDFSQPNHVCTCGGFKGATTQYTLGQSQDLALTTDGFCKSVVANYGNITGQEGNWRAIANDIQGCGGSCYSDWNNAVLRGRSLISKYCTNINCVNGAVQTITNQNQGSSSGGSGHGTGPTSGTSSQPGPRGKVYHGAMATAASGSSGSSKGTGPTSGAGSQPGPKGGNTGTVNGQKVNSNGVINPIPGFTNISLDFGVDADGVQNGQAILAPADCTVVGLIPDFYGGSWGPQPLVLYRFDQPLPGAPTQYWYVSEGIAPTSTSNGHHYKQGDTVATWRDGGTGIEIGWGTSSVTIASGRYAQLKLGAGQDHSGPAGNSSANVYGTNFMNYFSIGGGSPQAGGATGSGGGGSGGATDPFVIAKATAFATELQWPSIADTIEAVALQGKKSLMNDKPLIQFIQQVCSATMRSFQSAPNGDFYAFFPDYFGEFGHRDPYWRIDDVEVIEGDIQLNDSNLVTHMYVVGDTLMANEFGNPSTELLEKILSAGVVDIFDYFGTDGNFNTNINTKSKSSSSTTPSSAGAGSKTGGPTDTPLLAHSLHSQPGVASFLARYGARPVELDEPLIRSQFYEAFMAVEQFMLAWSMQFITEFQFTFMPELYPGARVQFGPPHNINMYINGVTHTFDYENGFTTSADLMAPSAAKETGDQSPAWGMVNSLR